MKDLIAAFPKHLETAIQTGRKTTFNSSEKTYDNVLIIGLGGSGIGAFLVSRQVSSEVSIPIVTVNSYFIPKWVSNRTLVIACSYSGNTEETIHAFELAKETGAELCCITSGGVLLDMASSLSLNHICIPSGQPPRSMLGYSLTFLFYALHKYGIISNEFESKIEGAVKLLEAEQSNIKEIALNLSEFLYQKDPILYGADHIEGMLIRWRQQINENAKMLCNHHVVPEMNHNELVGWRNEDPKKAVIFLRNSNDYSRIQKRIEINKEVIQKYTPYVTEIWSKGENDIERLLYLNSIGDWLYLYLSEKNQHDPEEIKVIEQLKAALAKF